MPLYEYQCDKCSHRFEIIQRFSDPPVEVCPVCGGPVHKLLSSPAIQFKGSGWYITDYARKQPATAAKEGSAESAGAGKSSPAADSSTSSSSASSDSTPTKQGPG